MRAGDVVRHPVVDGHVVELADRQRRREPGLAAVDGDVPRRRRCGDHPLGVRRDRSRGRDGRRGGMPLTCSNVLPPSMLLSIGTWGNQTTFGIGGCDGERRVVPGALPQRVAAGGERPVLAAVVGAEEAALLRFDQRVDAAGVRRRDRDADLAPDPLGQAVARELLPGVAAVAGDVEAAARAAAGQVPGTAPRLPEAGEDDVADWRDRGRRRRRRCPRPS